MTVHTMYTVILLHDYDHSTTGGQAGATHGIFGSGQNVSAVFLGMQQGEINVQWGNPLE
jgi:hypothetical protein